MKKHGRGGGPKRKSGERYPGGRLRQVSDCATPEHERHRNELVGDNPKKQRLAAHELGVRYARHDINGTEFGAGMRYARLFINAVNPIAIPSILGNLVAGAMILSTGSADQLAGTEKHPDSGATVAFGTFAREQFLSARKALGRCGSRVANAVDEIAVYDHPCELVSAREGLDALAQHFDLVDERRRRS